MRGFGSFADASRSRLAAAALFLLAGGLTAHTSVAAAPEQPSVALPARERFQLYLLIGQSNMAGRGAVEEQDLVPHPRVLMFTREEVWAPARDPLHFDKPIAGVSLGSAFGRAMADAHPNVVIGLIPAAVGGTPLSRWLKGQDLYDLAMRRAKAAMRDGTLAGILWHQGESDSHDEPLARSYGTRIASMIADMRAELGAGEVPFVAGHLGDFIAPAADGSSLPAGSRPLWWWKDVQAHLSALPEHVPNTGVVSANGLKHKGDGVHFDSPSLREFGRRYAAVMLALKQKASPSSTR